MKQLSAITKPSPRALEFLMYAVFACGMAMLVAFVLRSAGPAPAVIPPAQQPAVVHSQADSDKLRGYLNLPKEKIALVEFMDFECPPCRATYPKVKALLQQNPRVVYHPINLPLQMHTFAFPAAVASEVARSKGQFGKVFDDLFSGNVNLEVKSLNAYLTKQHLDPCVGTDRSKPFQDAVRKSMKLAEDMHIDSTPTLFVLLPDGSLTEVHSFDLLAKMLSSS